MEDVLEKYPSPKSNAKFTWYWENTLPDIKDRENLKFSHLEQLRVLCSIYCDRDELEEMIEMEGRTYSSMGRNGAQIKQRPEVALLKNCYSSIAMYSKMLGLLLVEDKNMNNVEEEEKNAFD